MTNKKILVLILIISALIGGVVWFNNQRTEQQQIISHKDPGLTADERKGSETRIADIQNKLRELSQDSKEERFKLYIILGAEQYSLGQLREARESYRQAVRLLPDNPVAWAELYTVENAMQDYESAKKSIERAVNLSPFSAQYWQWRIDIEEKLGGSRETIEALYKEALQKTNNHADLRAGYERFQQS
jgi:tetratricopeptide (TPR) repeat protein